MFSPRESVLELKLWKVNKLFYAAMKKVIATELRQAQEALDQSETSPAAKSKAGDDPIPSFDIIKPFVLVKEDLLVLKQMNAPPVNQSPTQTSLSLWILLLDSFGMETTQKVQNVISDVLTMKSSNKTKAEKYSVSDTWSAVQSQFKDAKLAQKLQNVSQNLVKEPVKPDTFKLALSYAQLRPNSYNIEKGGSSGQQGFQQAVQKILMFNYMVVKFHKQAESEKSEKILQV